MISKACIPGEHKPGLMNPYDGIHITTLDQEIPSPTSLKIHMTEGINTIVLQTRARPSPQDYQSLLTLFWNISPCPHGF